VLQQAEHAGVLKTDPKSPRFFYFISRQTVVLREARRFWSRVRCAHRDKNSPPHTHTHSHALAAHAHT